MESTNRTAESSATLIAGVALKNSSTPAGNVRARWKKTQRVYPQTTFRAWRMDWAAFPQFCKPRGLLSLPAAPSTVAAFIEACRDVGKKAGDRSPAFGDHCLRATDGQDPEPE